VRKVHPVNMTQSTKSCCEIVDERLSQDRAYMLVRCSLPDANLKTRRRVLAELLERRNTVGLIEWWTRGSIVRKPWGQFYIIVIADVSSK
jgi:hypothetical protein